MVNAAVPVLLNWIVCEAALPTETLPNAAFVGVMLRAACTPLPLIGITAFAPCVLVTVMFPVTDSALTGVNVTFRTAVFPAAMVVGVVIPLTCTSLPFTVI